MISLQKNNPLYNCWFEIYNLNCHLLSEETRNRGKNYLNFNRQHHFFQNYNNCFWLDGSNDETLWLVTSELLLHKEKLVLPELNKRGSTIFFTFAEGWCSDNLFNTIHELAKLFELCGDMTYQCCSVNVEDMYYSYLNKKNKKKVLTECVYKNVGFLSNNNLNFYIKPSPNIKLNILPFEQKKLFTSLNWNNWPHRQALIGLMNFYDLIDDGIISSPSANKFIYNPKEDYSLLHYTVDSFFKNDIEHDAILEKLPTILKNYPLTVDSRHTYKDTEEAVTKSDNVGPIYEARLNGLIEVVSETLFSGEHFFSEKTFLAINLKKPFIIVSGYRALKSLYKIGFKSFSPYIDESYDDEQDGIKRLKKIALELKRLKELRNNNPDEFTRVYKCMESITTYNKQIFDLYMTGLI